MNNLISGAIASIASLFKFFRLRQALVVVFAGFLLFTSTACAGSSVASEPGASVGTSPYDKNTGPQRELYAPTQKPQGGMNGYNDDPKYDRKSTKAQTEKVIQKSSQHLEDRAANPKEAVENLGDRDIPAELRDLSRDVGKRAERMKDDVSTGTQRGMRNLKQNLEDAKDAVPDVVNEAIN
jgi:gas vesicle protein